MEPKIREHSQRSPNARLQDEILLFLVAEHKVDTVAELARNLGAPRPSVSRAINSLASGGFVSKESGGWTLTETGEEEARQLRERRSDQLERYEMRPVLEALNSFADAAKDLERISEQLQLLTHFSEGVPQSPKEEVRHLQFIFGELKKAMDPLEELAERMKPLVSKFESPEEGAELPDLDARDLRLLIEMARAFERARLLSEHVSDGMNALTSLIDKIQSTQEEDASEGVDGPKSAPQPRGKVAITG